MESVTLEPPPALLFHPVVTNPKIGVYYCCEQYKYGYDQYEQYWDVDANVLYQRFFSGRSPKPDIHQVRSLCSERMSAFYIYDPCRPPLGAQYHFEPQHIIALIEHLVCYRPSNWKSEVWLLRRIIQATCFVNDYINHHFNVCPPSKSQTDGPPST